MFNYVYVRARGGLIAYIAFYHGRDSNPISVLALTQSQSSLSSLLTNFR